ncbi:MAG: STT3 domain-containing protein [archaeon]
MKDKLANFWKNLDKKQLFFLVMIFLLAFGIRGHLMKYDLFFGFDSYYHARMLGYVLQDGWVPEMDPLAYFQHGGTPTPKDAPVFWFISAVLYKIITLGAAYNKELLIMVIKILPALYGALISVAMFFLGKAMYNKKAGYAMAVVAATVPAFVYRTMAGFFEEDSMGFLWLVLGLVFLVKTLKEPKFDKNSVKNAVISAVFFGLMAWSWAMFIVIPLILIGYIIFTLIIMWFRGVNRKKILNFIALFLIIFLLFGGIATIKDQGKWAKTTFGYIEDYIPVGSENLTRIGTGGKGTDPSILAQTVGEENTGKQFFGIKYNILIVLPILALILIPLIIIFKKKDFVSLTLFFWIALTFFMAWNKLKFTYTFGLPIAAAAGVVCYAIFEATKNRSGFEKKTIALLFGFIILTGIGASTLFVSQKVPSIETAPGWKGSLEWIRVNTPEDASFLNWWDEGHWITFLAERKVMEDNQNNDFTADQDTAKFILSESEAEAYGIIEKYGATYVILSEDLLSKEHSLAYYAYNTMNNSDPRIVKLFMVNEDNSVGPGAVVFYCSRKTDELSMKTTFTCGPNTLDEAQMNFIPTIWAAQPNQLQGNQYPIFIYREEDNGKLYLFNLAVNNSFLVRLWMNDPSIEHFEEVYAEGQVKVFKVV